MMVTQRQRLPPANLLRLLLQLFCLATMTTVPTPTVVAAQETSNPSTWYKRYAVYPPYCSTPDAMANRTIPSLPTDAKMGQSRLIQVVAIIRHGARTPYDSHNCWKGYHENPETSVWDCNLTTFVSPPPPDRVQQEEESEEHVGTQQQGMFLFEKHYDALYNPSYNLSNKLKGTCQKGQLLLQGYEQELANGEHLRDVYVYSGSDDKKHDPRMRLLDASSTTKLWDHLYYRVDDDQRTVMSGQIVLRGVLGNELDAYVKKNNRYPVLHLHTADRERDILDPNEMICPRLAEMKERYQASRDFRAFDQSQEVQTLRHFQQHVLGVVENPTGSFDMDGGIDCLMTTICTDRPLPAAIDDYTGGDEDSEKDFHPPQNLTDYGTNLFLRLYNYFVRSSTNLILANEAEYAKLSMAPLWTEILDNINGSIQKQDNVCCPLHPVPKLAVFSGHDTTLIPLLASIGAYDEKWPPYGSMAVIEIHELNLDGQANKDFFPSGFGFRLVYNGEVITHRILACRKDAHVCDVSHLIRVVSKFATREPSCARQHPVPVVHTDTISQTTELLSTNNGLASFIFLILGSMAFGAVGTYLYMSNEIAILLRRRKYRRARSARGEENDGLEISRIDGSGSSSHEHLDAAPFEDGNEENGIL